MRQAEQKDKRALTVKEKKGKIKKGGREGKGERKREGRRGAMFRQQMVSFTPIVVARALAPD